MEFKELIRARYSCKAYDSRRQQGIGHKIPARVYAMVA